MIIVVKDFEERESSATDARHRQIIGEIKSRCILATSFHDLHHFALTDHVDT